MRRLSSMITSHTVLSTVLMSLFLLWCQSPVQAQSIEIVSPSPGTSFDGCSYYSPPAFQWSVNGLTLKTIEVQFSGNTAFEKKVKVIAKKDALSVTMKAAIWKKILLLPGTTGGTVYWRVIGTGTNKIKTISTPSTIVVAGPEAVTHASASQAVAGAPPTVSWENGCNKKFKVWLGTSDDMPKQKSMPVSLANPYVGEGRVDKALPKGTWSSLLKLAGSSDFTLYWYVESWDALNRYSQTSVMGASTEGAVTPLQLEPYTYKAYLQVGGPLETIFTMKKPKGWDVTIAGMCSSLAFLVQDPKEALSQLFYFGNIYPVYTSQAMKDFEVSYCEAAPLYCPSWTDAPVVSPLTVENFFSHWPEISTMKNATAFMANFPHLTGFQVVSTTPQAAMMGSGSETKLIRGLFNNGAGTDAKAAQGQFLASVLPDAFYDKGGGYIVFGATAPIKEFKTYVNGLVESLNSFTMSDTYFNWCVTQSAQQWGAISKIGQTLSEASDIMWDGWQERTATQDIMAYQYDDSLKGIEKVWDPATGKVYQFDVGWFAQYQSNQGLYNISTLELLPSDRLDLWESPVLDGPSHVHLY